MHRDSSRENPSQVSVPMNSAGTASPNAHPHDAQMRRLNWISNPVWTVNYQVANVPWEIPVQLRAVVTPLTTRGFAMGSNPAAFQTPSFLLDEAKPEKAPLSQRSRCESALTTQCCPRTRLAMAGSMDLVMVIFGSPHQNLPLKPWSCHPSPCTGWCILVLSTCCQLGPSGRILSLAAAVFAVTLVLAMCIQTLAGNLLTSAYLKGILC